MSSIDKLLIRGVRSFSPYTENTIDFYTPLTIIVGPNGAGKTTVIECLKYATTGDLPPNAKGGAFIHDPKVSREVEVKAQIKLKFRNARGQPMVCTRSIQSTQRKTKLEQKTLESCLSTTDPITGEILSVSSRCAEMDSVIPIQLGVSSAVLENVIFCHQEDSFWPLSEPALLKKKFDDIFSATKYTKALETLKNMRKELMADIKVEHQKLEHLRFEREKALKISNDVEKAEAECEERHQTISTIESHIKQVAQQIESLTKQIDSLNDLRSNLTRIEYIIATDERCRDELVSGLRIINISVQDDVALQQALEDHISSHGQDSTKLNAWLSREVDLESDLKRLTVSLAHLNTEIGVLHAEEDRTLQKQSELEFFLQKLADMIDSQISQNLDSIQIIEFFNLVREKAREKGDQLATIKYEIEEEEDNRAREIQSMYIKLASSRESLQAKYDLIQDKEMKVEGLQQRIQAINFQKKQLDQVEADKSKLKAELSELEFCYNQSDYGSALIKLKKDLDDSEEEVSILNKQMCDCSLKMEANARYFHVKREVFNKTKIIENLHESINVELKNLKDSMNFDTTSMATWDPLDNIVNEIETNAVALAKIVKHHDDIQGKLSVAFSKNEHYKDLFTKKQDELSKKQLKIQASLSEIDEDVCSGTAQSDFDMCLEEVEANLASINEEIRSTLSSNSVYETFIRSFGASKNCPLCERGFGSTHEEHGFGQKLNSFLSSLPERTLQLEERKKKLEVAVSRLRSLNWVHDDVRRLEEVEIPEILLVTKTLEIEIDQLKVEFAESSQEIVYFEKIKFGLGSIKTFGEKVRSALDELCLMKTELSSFDQSEDLSGEDLSKIKERLDTVIKWRDSIKDDLRRRESDLKIKDDEISLKKTEYRELCEAVMSIKIEQSDRLRLEEQLVEELSVIESIKKEIPNVKKLLDDLGDKIVTTERCKDEFLGSLRDREKIARDDLSRLMEMLRQCMVSNTEISEAKARVQENKPCLEEKLVKLEDQRFTTDRELSRIKTSIQSLQKGVAEYEAIERHLRDNIRYRELSKRISLEREERDVIIKSINEKGQFSDEKAVLGRLEMRHGQLMGERSGIFGEIRQLQDQISRQKGELMGDYAHADARYREQYVRVGAIDTAIEDLEKYARALDQAIMRYHSHKMGEVNRIIREIWTSTYRGADIDTIEIRADHDGAANGTQAVGGRSYNYRVVMVKCGGETELDMRGRSSAGQRVLASLIIRLALAETFGQHCGMLALDEPTTNLDRENIESLAEALAEIIRTRSMQGANFQLIIITHDEEFVESLGRQECADYYWRVVKDSLQYSTIRREAFQGELS